MTNPKTSKRWTADAIWRGMPHEVNAIADTKEDAIAQWEAENYTDITNVEERTPRLGWTVVFGNFKWGGGTDLTNAKAQFRKQGGRLSDGYAIAVFDDETDFLGFGDMGYFYFGNAPEVTEVAPTKKKGSKR